MATAKLSEMVTRLGRGAVPPAGEEPDAELVGRFVAARDEAAFAELVRRHGPLVLGVCRRVTGHHHLAEDAFQAVFVVLATKAGCIRPRSAVAAWLYGVAYRTALRARTMADRRRRREAPVGTLPEPTASTTDPAEVADHAAVLDAEVAGLPESLRLPVVLCELEGKPRKEAARELGIPEGTLSSRLAAARKALAGRLRSRGVTLSAAGLSVALGRLASATVPAPLAARAAAALTPAMVPAPVAVLSRGVMRIMFLSKLKAIALVVIVALGGVLTWAVLAPAAPPGSPQPARLPAVAPGVLIQPAAKADAKPLPKGPNKLLVWRKGELAMIDPDGTNEKTVIAQGEKGGIHQTMFSLSPDGTKIAVVAPPPNKDDNQRELQAHLFVRELGKDGPGTDLGPASMAHWAGDGTELFVCQFIDGQQPSDIRPTHTVINLATKARTPIKLPETHIMTDGSRDGRFFLTMKLGTDRDHPFGGIFVMNRDGSEHKQLTDAKTWAVFGRFSPDGRRVLFMSGELKEETPAEKKARDEVGARRPPPRFNKLVVAEIASGKATPVADVPLNADLQGFCWSPDGKRIAYVWREVHEGDPKETQNKETQSHLVTCDADGKNQKTLLSETGKGQYEITLAGVDWR
jgi:RNA polymerase sigma factor (sigma-70 family)